MIAYNKHKRFYAETGLFTLTGSNYEGYVEVLSGVPYTSSITLYNTRCTDVQTLCGIQLDRATTYKTDLLCSDFFFDRIITDASILPYTLDEILIAPNDFLNYNLLKLKLSKLNTNTTYTYSRCFIPTNNLPTTSNLKYAGCLNSTQTSIDILTGFQSAIHFSGTTNFKDLGDIKNFIVTNYIEDENKSVIFAYTDTKFISISCSDTGFNVIEVSPYYQTRTSENTLTFSSIGGMTKVGTYLFITDTGNDTIIKYDIAGYINGDTVLANKRNIIEIICGRGGVKDKLLFNAPKEITANNTNIIVHDSANYVFKVYDLDFNYTTTIGSVNLRTERFAAIEYNKLLDTLYVLTYTRDNKVKLYVLDRDCYDILETYTLDITLQAGEEIRNIEFSLNDSNYFYVCTLYNVYKFLVNKPAFAFGRYGNDLLKNNVVTNTTLSVSTSTITSSVENNNIWNYINIPWDQADYYWSTNTYTTFISQISSGSDISISTIYNDNFKGYRITSQSTNSDKVFMISLGRIYYFNESNSLDSVLKLDNFANFGNTFTLRGDEYIQGSTLNKEFYKIIRDILELKNNLKGRFTGFYDSMNIFRYSTYNYNIDLSEIFNTTTNEYFIHDNEKTILGVFNRVITQMYNLQLGMISLTQPDRGDGIVPVFNGGSDEPSNVLIIE